jgi:hypothetical protein
MARMLFVPLALSVAASFVIGQQSSPDLILDEFHFSAAFKCFDPLFVWHFRISSGEISVCP